MTRDDPVATRRHLDHGQGYIRFVRIPPIAQPERRHEQDQRDGNQTPDGRNAFNLVEHGRAR